MNTRITVNYGMTINKGNYESERIDLECSTDVPEEGNAQEEATRLFNGLKQHASELTGGFRGR